jgi:hypothetical protein
MARRISTGITGRNVLGSLVAVDNSLRSVVDDEDVILQASGTGIGRSTTDFQINGRNSLRLADTDSSNFVALRAPDTVASNITYTLPGSGVNADYFLKTDASGNLSWSLAAVSVTNQTTDTTVYYPTITTATTGTLTAVSTSNTKLTFVPSTGTLTTTAISTGTLTITGAGTTTIPNADINGGSIDETTIGAATAAAGTFTTMTATTIVETSSIALKENVSPITGALDAIMQLVGVTYDRKDGSSKNEAGLIKEEVEKVLPNLVKDDGIHYTKLTAYLIEAVKELTAEVNTLKGNRS